MRLARLLIAASAIALTLTPAFAPLPAAAQQAPAPASPLSLCKGTLNIVRLSDVKPGMMQKFLDAAAAQQAWYKAAGTTDRVRVLRVMEQDATTKSWSLSETQAITTHSEPDGQTKTPHDAAWDAFVAIFADSSTIKTQYVTCIVP